MNFHFRLAILFLARTAAITLATDADIDSDDAASPRAAEAKVVDTPAMKAHPKPPEHPDWHYARPEYGQSVQVRTAPAKKARVFALFAGGADVEVQGDPVKRDGAMWADVEFLGVRGWVPLDRLSTTSDELTAERRWDIRFISPSRRVVVEYVNRSVGSVYVIKDGAGRDEYRLNLGPAADWRVAGMVPFPMKEVVSFSATEAGTGVRRCSCRCARAKRVSSDSK